MPKKRVPTYDTKPKSPAHPALSSSGKSKDAHSLGSVYSPTGNLVNDRIQQSRSSHGASSSSSTGRTVPSVLNPNANPSLPPLLRNILQLEDAPPPRPRPGLRVTGRMRGLAGPVPPSWLLRTRESRTGRQLKIRNPNKEEKLEPLPGSFIPENGSLMVTALKRLAENWTWHIVYDQYYLATLPIRYKESLLYYISCYSPRSLDKASLELLFLDETELQDATGTDGLIRLDLSTSIGQLLKLSELKGFFTAKKATATTMVEGEVLLDDWDTPEFCVGPSNLPRFHTLTHLSLSKPSGMAIWKELLDLSPHLTMLTHLALAYWPVPTLSPNSMTAYRETPQGNVDYGASNLYSAYSGDWNEAASILRRLSKSTYCLKWLDVTGCYPWAGAFAEKQIDWCGAWQALEIVKTGQGWVPECFQEGAGADQKLWQEWHRESRYLQPTSRSQALERWAKIEHYSLELQDAINAQIVVRAAQRHVPVHAGPSDADWSSTSSSAEGLKPGSRTTRVTFEREWDAWWVKEAIEELNR